MDKDTGVVLDDVKAGKACLLDVRTEKEWQLAHAKNAQHFELAQLEQGEMPKIDKNIPIYTYCGSGNRAGKAADILQKAGYKAVNGGGLAQWQKAEGEA